MAHKQVQWWLPIALFLFLAAATGGVLLVSNQRGNQPLEIVLPTPTPTLTKQVYIDGAVTTPGLYTAQDSDRLEDLLRAAGGMTNQADPNQIRIIVPRASETSSPQKVNINTADVWLLDALPGIGEGLAKAIINYRNQNGPFRLAQDITKVPGISQRVYERIENLITVGE